MEKRINRRVPIRAAVSLRTSDDQVVHGWASDLSMSGVHVATDEELPPGTKCEASITYRDGHDRHRIVVNARVARNDTKGIGVEFLNSTKDITDEITHLIVSYTPA